MCKVCLAKISVIKPPFCPVCGRSVPHFSHICGKCISIPPPFSNAISLFSFDGPIRELIHSLKYQGDRHSLKAIAECVQRVDPELCSKTIPVVPVPLHKTRLRQRGFNQSLLLARELFPLCSVHYNLLRRIRHTRPQVELTGEERSINVQGAFWADDAAKGMETALLVDDVFTTGATLTECATALVKAGVKKVEVFTVARVFG